MSKKGTAEELALAMILEQRRKAKAEGKDKDKPVISPEVQKAFGRVLNLWKRVIIVNLKIGVPCYSKQLFAQVVKVRIL